jgi:hypothetical protein
MPTRKRISGLARKPFGEVFFACWGLLGLFKLAFDIFSVTRR